MQTTTLLYVASLLLPDTVSAAGSSTPRIPARPIATTDSSSASSSSSSSSLSLNLNRRIKVPGESPAYYCSDPSHDLFQIRRLDFIPTNPRIGYSLTTRFIGDFVSSTGDVSWLNITGSINGRLEREPLYYSPLCDIDVFQAITVQSPAGDYDETPRFHRSCPPSIQEGYALVSSPPMPLSPQTVPEGRYEVRADAMTQDGRRIFCVEGSFYVTR